MKKYTLELYGKNIQHEFGIPTFISSLYLKLFGIPLGKRFRFKMAEKFLKNEKLSGKKILDVGCGIGDFSFTLANRGCDVIGVDLNKEKIEIANEVATNYSFSNISFLCQDIMKIDNLPIKFFDGIICLAVLEHIEDDKSLIEKSYDILRNGGFLILNVPTNLRKLVKQKEIEDGHVRAGYSEGNLKQMLMDAGFAIIEVSYSDPLGLNYYYNNYSTLLPGKKFRVALSSIIFPIFFILVLLSNRLFQDKGSEIAIKCLKK